MARWDIGRFIQTITEFDVLPWSRCLKRWLGQQDRSVVRYAGGQEMGLILFIGNNSATNQRMLATLVKQHYRVRSLGITTNLPQVDQRHGEINADAFRNVSTVLIAADASPAQINNALHLAQSQPQLRSPNRLLFDFEDPTPDMANVWGAVDDVVMGGVSESQLRLGSDQAIFAGIVSTENNGGFASVRTHNFSPPWDLSAYQGFLLTIRGDGQRYKFITRCEGKWDGIGYSFSFDTVVNQWQSIEIPFANLVPVFRAKTVPEVGSFDSSKVYAMQLMLSKFEYDGRLNPHFQAGAFELGIQSIYAYGAEPRPRLILLSHHTHLQEQLQETTIPYCLIHLQSDEVIDLAAQIVTIMGDRQAVNQIKTWPEK